MTPPDEVLRKMAEAAGYAEFIMCDAATCNGMCEAPEVHFAPAIQRALTAAAECGWVMVPAAEHKRLTDRVAALDEPYVDDRGEHWRAPTAHAYAAVCKALRTCKVERDAARAAAPKVKP